MMEKVEIEKQAAAVVKVRERDEATRKEYEAEWRKSMSRDTAGTVLTAFQHLSAQLAGLQAQVDAHHPVGALARAVEAAVAKITEVDQRLAELEKKLKGG